MIPIRDYESQYTLSVDGVVTRIETGRVLRPAINKQTGYLYVSLWKANRGRTVAVHRLVAEHFVPNPDGKPFVNHKDSERLNPCASNLEWSTQSENMLHGYAEGFMSQEARRNFKDLELDLLLQSVLAGETMTVLAEGAEVGLSRLTINLRKRAVTLGIEPAFNAELYRQKCARNAAANAHKRKAVLQWLRDGTYIQHESASAAARSLGKSSSGSITNALDPNKPQKEAFGFLWTFK